MSELQLGLLAIGIAIVAAVFGYHKWQESRYRREAESSIAPPGEDVLLRQGAAGRGRLEPTLQTKEPVVEDTVPPGRVQEAAAAAPALNDAIDFILTLEAAAPVPAKTLVSAAAARLRAMPKAIHMEGESAASESGPGWERLNREGSYRLMRIGMQLADRNGTVTGQDLNAFVSAAEQPATAAGLLRRPADVDAALRTASELDQLCGEVDIQIGLHLVPAGEAFAAARVAALSEAAGLSLERDGRFRLRDEHGREVFNLTNEEPTRFSPSTLSSLTTSALLLELDVPRAPGGPAAFARFREFALQAAATLGGSLVDDNRSELGPSSFDAIAAQLQPVYASMESRGMAPGSPVALRLFS
jgi:hypothetical protein